MRCRVELFDFLSSAATWMKVKLVLIDSGGAQDLTFESSNHTCPFSIGFCDFLSSQS
jgi:hypothetical protein